MFKKAIWPGRLLPNTEAVNAGSRRIGVKITTRPGVDFRTHQMS